MDSFLSKPLLLGKSRGASGAFALQRRLGSPQGLFLDFTDDSSLIIDGAVPANNYRGKAFDKLTFTRASTRKRFNSAGLLEDVASGLPAIDYDPIARAIRGLQIEGARTNLLTYSEAFDNAAWTKSGCSISANAATGVDGAISADVFVEDSATSAHFISQSYSNPATSTAHTVQWAVKAVGTRTEALVRVVYSNGANETQFRVNLSTFGVVQLANGLSATCTAYSTVNGFVQIVLTFTTPASNPVTDLLFRFHGYNGATSYAGSGSDQYAIAYTQLEAGAIPSSYIPTTSATVTRAAELCKIATTLFPATAQGPYTIFVKGIMPLNNASDANRVIASLSTNSFAESRYISRMGAGSGAVVANNVTASSGNAAVGGLAVSALAALKAAARFDLNNTNAAINGTLGTNDTVCAYPSAPTQLNIGNLTDAQTSHWHGWIQQIAVIPVALTDAQLQAVTA